VPQGTTESPNRSYVASETAVAVPSTRRSWRVTVASSSPAWNSKFAIPVSASTTVTSCSSASAIPSASVLVVFPVPPFPLATANASTMRRCVRSPG